MSHVTHSSLSCHIRSESCHTYKWVMSHIEISHVTLSSLSCQKYTGESRDNCITIVMCTCVCVCLCVCMYMCARARVCMCVCVCMRMRVYVCDYVCACILVNSRRGANQNKHKKIWRKCLILTLDKGPWLWTDILYLFALCTYTLVSFILLWCENIFSALDFCFDYAEFSVH